MIEPLSAFMHQLWSAASFEAAAEQVLDRVMHQLSPLCAASDIRVLRGMVHLRPDDTYRGIVVRETGAGRERTRVVPSLTAWRWVEAAGEPVLFTARANQAAAASGAAIAAAGTLAHSAFRSREGVLGRHTTHILALPLRRPGGQLDGFVSVELDAGDAEHALPGWPDVAAPLQLLVDMAAPFVGELPRAPGQDVGGDPLLPVVGAAMQPLVADLGLFAETDATILLQGETGVGKNRLARWCWARSPRQDRPYVVVNLATVPEHLREGHLFGWRKGSFTGADESRHGLVASAHGGTLFIDEIDKLPVPGQAALLSLLDEGHYRVIGDTESQEADIRFIIGTNANLRKAMEEDRFLKDLYYRIRTMPVRIPPLRQRRDEIVPWAEHMFQALHKKRGAAPDMRLEAAAGTLLEREQWPGNLRQLNNVVQRAYAFATRQAQDAVTIGAAHIEAALAYERDVDDGEQVDHLIAQLERAATAYVDVAVRRAGGLELDHASAFAGLVLDSALGRLDKAEALRVLGKQKSMDSKNEHKLINSHRERVQRLRCALAQDP